MEFASHTVLLIEDDPDHTELIRRSFGNNRNDMQLIVAATLEEARRALAELAPSVVLCDYHLPDGTGLDILRQYARAASTMPPFVLLTSHGDETVAVEAMKAGATDYIVKTERSLASLPDICRALIGGYRQRLEKEALVEERLRLFDELKANEKALFASKQRLEKSEQLLNRAQEMAHLGCWEYDALSERLYLSDEAYRILGLAPRSREASYLDFQETVHPEDKAMVAAAFLGSLEGGSGGHALEYRLVRKGSGEVRHVHGKWDHIRGADGRLERTVGIIHDITDRKRAEEHIIQSEERFSKAFDNAPVMISITTLHDGVYLDVNKKFCELSGFAAEEVIGRNAVELRIITPEIRERILKELKQKGQVSGLEITMGAKNGKPITVLYHGEVITVDGGRCLLSISIDISGHRHLEEQLRQSQKMEAIGQLAGGVAHDFNNILTVIMGYGNLLKTDESLAADAKDAVEQILTSSERAAQLTNGLLAFSRKQITSTRICNLNDIVQRVRSFLLRTIGENIEFNALCHPAPLSVSVDSGQIEQVLINLATNARDAMPGGGLLNIKTEQQDLDRSFVQSHGYGAIGSYAVLTVSDNGIGMDAETRGRIFEPFFTTKRIGKGTGLGMAIVYGIVQQHHGFIYVYSEPAVGTTFRIYLPIAHSPYDPAVESVPPVKPRGGTETILVAEDEPSVRKLVHTVLKNAGYRVILAEDGQDCVDQFRAHRGEVDLILMDMIMPKKNGIQVCEEIRVEEPEIKVLYCSGYAPDFILNRQHDIRELDIVMKPVKPPELLKAVREMLDR